MHSKVRYQASAAGVGFPANSAQLIAAPDTRTNSHARWRRSLRDGCTRQGYCGAVAWAGWRLFSPEAYPTDPPLPSIV